MQELGDLDKKSTPGFNFLKIVPNLCSLFQIEIEIFRLKPRIQIIIFVILRFILRFCATLNK